MRTSRKLSLKRDELGTLDASGLASVGGRGPDTTLDTCASCLDYISCWWFQCLPRELTKLIGPA